MSSKKLKKFNSITTFGERLKEAIKKSDLKQAELARLTKIHPNMLSKYTQDKTEPGISKVKLLSFYLNCDPVWLITGFTGPELITKQQNDKISMSVSESCLEYRVHDNVEAVNKYLKLTTAHKKVIDVLINELLKLEGEK